MAAKPANETTVAVLGGGLAGLACAWELSRRGYRISVIEKEKQVGGLARTIRLGDYSFDTGPHRWYSKRDEINDFMKGLMAGDLLDVKRFTRISYGKRLINYPIRPLDILLKFGPFFAAQAFLDFLFTQTRLRFSKKPAVTMKDAYIAQFGGTLYKAFFETYSNKLWGLPCEELSGDWVAQRSRGLTVFTLIKNILMKSRVKKASLVDRFQYPRRGVGELAERFLQGIQSHGGRILTGSSVKRVEWSGKQIAQICFEKDGQEEGESFDWVVSSIPLTNFTAALSPAPPPGVLSLAQGLRYRGVVLVALFVNKEKITDDNWIYVQNSESGFVRYMEMGNFSRAILPPGKNCIVLEYPCQENDATWKTPEKELIEQAVREYTAQFDFLTSKDIWGGHVVKIAHHYPIYTLGYNELVQKLKEYLGGLENLILIGRQGLFRYNNMDHSIEMGLLAARNIQGDMSRTPESVNLEQEYLEEKVK